VFIKQKLFDVVNAIRIMGRIGWVGYIVIVAAYTSADAWLTNMSRISGGLGLGFRSLPV